MANFDWHEGIGDVFYWLAAEARGRGYATKAVRLISDWAFETLELERLELYAHPDNTASQRVAERAGYIREGRPAVGDGRQGPALGRRALLAPAG